MPVSAAPRHRLGLVLACSALALLAIGLLGAATARAEFGTYTIEPCGGNIPREELQALAGLEFREVNGDRFDADADNCNAAGGSLLRLVGHNTQVETGFRDKASWIFNAPAGSEIRKFSFDQHFEGAGWNQGPGAADPTNLGWRLDTFIQPTEFRRTLEEAGHAETFRSTPVDAHIVHTARERTDRGEFLNGTTQIEMVVGCIFPIFIDEHCASNSPESEVISDTSHLQVTLLGSTDNSIASVGGQINDGTVQSGTRSYVINVNSASRPGLYFTEVWAGGRRVAKTFANDNGGRCPADGHFFTLTPCLITSQSPSADIDTTTLANGVNQVKVVACNATANPAETHLDKTDCSTTPAASFTVENVPLNFTAPVLSPLGAPQAGSTLSATEGTWAPGAMTPRSFASQWERCAPGGGSCAPIPGAVCGPTSGGTPCTYTTTGDDVGKSLRLKISASANAALGQTTTVASQLTPPVRDLLINTTPPVIAAPPKAGVKLSAGLGVWDDAADSPISFAQRWLRCPATVTDPGQCEPIAGATDTTYTPVKADVGKRVMLEVTASVSTPEALSRIATSAPSTLVAEADPAKEGGKRRRQRRRIRGRRIRHRHRPAAADQDLQAPPQAHRDPPGQVRLPLRPARRQLPVQARQAPLQALRQPLQAQVQARPPQLLGARGQRQGRRRPDPGELSLGSGALAAAANQRASR
jgi:hypothetical protein